MKVTFALLSLLLSFAAAPALADDDGAHGTVLVTGANRGLGYEFARQYAEDGWNVIGTARSPERADALKALGVRVLQLDVTDPESVAELADTLDGEPIDLLINNAGIFPRVSALAEIDIDAYLRTLNVNTVGPVRVTQALLPNLVAGKGRKIVGITSQLASIDKNSGGFYGYRESKAALNMFTSSLAAELGPNGFICLAIHPGWVATDMGGPEAPLSPEDSVAAMKSVIDGATADDNGRYKSYKDDVVPW